MGTDTSPIRVVVFTVMDDVVQGVQEVVDARGDRLVGIVTAPGPRARRSEEYRSVLSLARPGVDVVASNYPDRWADMIRPMKPDALISFGFNWKLPADVLEVPRIGAVNGHDALLPRNRGRNATGWALRTGDPVYGVTLHRMTPEFDDGPVLAQRHVAIADDEDFDDVFPRFVRAAGEAMYEALGGLLAGCPGVPQDPAEVSYSPGLFEPEWRELTWEKPVRDVFFQLRSWYGARGVPRGAFGEVDGERLLITKARPTYERAPATAAAPGTVLSRDNGEILIQCADAPLRILAWEPAEG